MADQSIPQTIPDCIAMPAATVWPVLMAFGLTATAAGLVTEVAISLLGGIVTIVSAVGWFRAVLPHEAHESLEATTDAPNVATSRREVDRLQIAPDVNRVWLPLEVYPVSAGVRGGLAGGVVMAALAMAYGVLSHDGIWYPINLLVAGFFPQTATTNTAELTSFNVSALLIAVPLHLLMSVTVGLLYGAMLPLLPRSPILLGGVVAPLMWSGLIHGVLELVNPVLNQRISWSWFVLSQLGFGIVAGLVVSRQERIMTRQSIPFAIRAGIEAAGMRQKTSDVEDPR